MFNSKTKHHDVAYVLRHFAAEPAVDSAHLRRLYDAFDAEYTRLLREHIALGMDIDEEVRRLAAACRARLRDWLPGGGGIGVGGGAVPVYLNPGVMHAAAPVALAHLFAMWTARHAAHFLEAEADSDRSYLLMPHAAQVVAALCMLGLSVPGEVRSRNLVQVMTGEGKSVVLAATASVLALVGVDVSCACYSDMLSARDHADFRFLFEALGVGRAVHYGTFGALAERIINHGGDVRDLALTALCAAPPAAEAPPASPVAAGSGGGRSAERGDPR